MKKGIKKVKNNFFITLHCVFDKKLSLEEVHNTASRIEYLVRQKLPKVHQVVVHTEPEKE